ncbi:MAG: CBS domain-containing protein [Methanomassiliicoccales archaeon]
MKSPKVRDIMTTSVVTLGESTDLHRAAVTLAVNGISGAPVVGDRGGLEGIISSKDILRFIRDCKERESIEHPTVSLLSLPLDDLEDEGAIKIRERISSTPVSDIMERDVVVAHPDDDILEMTELMLEKDVKRLPVLEGERVIGIVTLQDIIWCLYKRKGAC